MLGAGFNPDARAFVLRLRPDGSRDRSFGANGEVRWPYSTYLGWVVGAERSDGDVVVVGTTRFGAIDEHATVHVDLLDPHGRRVRGFGGDGDVVLRQPACLRGPTGLAVQGREILLALLRWCSLHEPQSIVLLRLRANGTLDTSFGKGGSVTVGPTSTFAVPSSPVLSLVGGRSAVVSAQATGKITITQLLRNGEMAPHFGSRGTVWAAVGPQDQYPNSYGLFVGKARILTAAGCSQAGPFLARFNAGGSPYRFWAPNFTNTNVESLGGALGIGCGYFTVARNNDFVGAGRAVLWFRPEDGLLDLAHPVSRLPDGAIAAAIAPSKDGSVLVASQRDTTAFVSRFR